MHFTTQTTSPLREESTHIRKSGSSQSSLCLRINAQNTPSPARGARTWIGLNPCLKESHHNLGLAQFLIEQCPEDHQLAGTPAQKMGPIKGHSTPLHVKDMGSQSPNSNTGALILDIGTSGLNTAATCLRGMVRNRRITPHIPREQLAKVLTAR